MVLEKPRDLGIAEYMKKICDSYDRMIDILTEMIEGNERKGLNLSKIDFLKFGEEDPKEWLRRVEMFLPILQIDDKKKMEIVKSYMEGMAYVCEEVEKTLEEDFEIRYDNIILKDEEDAIKEKEIEAPIFIQQPTMSAIAFSSMPQSITATSYFILSCTSIFHR
ncbi:hypothetical protein Adt_06417 [Abeliophyllum distichum]|uniref:Uncharacterized protein n=1 Tax=Abeliophyllum distichum TaxID=126358 RepID=A0ABD1V6X2_9LAMI